MEIMKLIMFSLKKLNRNYETNNVFLENLNRNYKNQDLDMFIKMGY